MSSSSNSLKARAREIQARDGVNYTTARRRALTERSKRAGVAPAAASADGDTGTPRATIEQLAAERFAAVADELRTGPLSALDAAMTTVGAAWPRDATLMPADHPQRIADDLATRQPSVEEVERVLDVEPRRVIAGELHDILCEDEREVLGWLMRSDVPCEQAPITVDVGDEPHEAVMQMLDEVARLRPPRSIDALAVVRRALARAYPATGLGANWRPAVALPLTGDVAGEDLRHAHARTFDRAATPGESTRGRWYQAIPLINATLASDATVGDVERAQLAIAELGGAALRDLRHLLAVETELPPLRVFDLEGWMETLALFPTPAHWRRPDLTVAEVMSEWVAEVGERVDRATLAHTESGGAASDADRAGALAEAARLCAEVHATLRSLGVEFSR